VLDLLTGIGVVAGIVCTHVTLRQGRTPPALYASLSYLSGIARLKKLQAASGRTPCGGKRRYDQNRGCKATTPCSLILEQ